MANTPDMANCIGGDNGLGDLLPLSPYSALSYHFGMLLGVDDFETEQAYHRAKHRLHNAWLHREGVVWGFGVTLDQGRGEIKVTSGLALDAAGRELHLEADACLNVEKWLEKHKEDPNLEIESTTDQNKILRAHVVIRFKACLTRQVPAFMEPCNNAGTGTAYSRVFETVEILMRPGPPPIKKPPYHRLRLLFGLETAETAEGGAVKASDQQVLDARAAIQALPSGDQPPALMTAFHRFAALDEIELKPAMSEDDARLLLFPGRDDEAVVLAGITNLTLTKDNGAWKLSGGEVETSVRPAHVATTTIQDLLCGPIFGASEPPAGAETGPQVDPESVTLKAQSIEFKVNKALQAVSVNPAAFSVTRFNSARGWQSVNFAISYDGANTIKLTPESDISGRVRLIVFGTGPTPILGSAPALIPLAGALNGPPGTQHDGHDFVHMQDIAEEAVEGEEEAEPEKSFTFTEKAAGDQGTDAVRRSNQKGKTRRDRPVK